MDLTMLGTLMVLALIDSTSIGTLVVPLVLLLTPRLHLGRFFVYLMTIGGFYFGVGVALLFGARVLLERYGDALRSPGAYIGLGVLGIGLLIASWFVDPGKHNRERRKAGLAPEPSRWERRLAGSSGTGAVIVTALLAGSAELAGMLPYLAGIGIITGTGLPVLPQLLLLAGYVAVMLVPAIALLSLRILLGRHSPRLARVRETITRTASDSLPWVLGIVGVLVTFHALGQLSLAGVLPEILP